MIRAAILIALAAPAAAQDAAFWGGTGCQIVAVENAPHVAEITCLNVLTAGNSFDEGVISAGVATVAFTIHHGPGDIPDRFTFTGLGGTLVLPEMIEVPEHGSGVALVYEWAGM